jgi:hypothetical protein
MKMTITYSYEQSVDEIAASFLDADFLSAKLEAVGSRDIDISVEGISDTEFQVTVSREVPADVPRALKSFISPWNKAVQTEKWNGADGGPYHADIAVDSKGVPADMSSTVDLKADGEGCECTIVTDIDCSVPLVGKKLAQFIAKAVEDSLDDEHAFIAEHA